MKCPDGPVRRWQGDAFFPKKDQEDREKKKERLGKIEKNGKRN